MYKHLLISLSIIVFVSGCSDPVDLAKEKLTIQRILQQERKAHFDKNIDLFFSTFADSMISVHHGDVEIKSLADNRKRFEPYFNRVNFVKWDDTAEPIIDISSDGTMAFAAVKKVVVVTYSDSLNNTMRDSTNYAWVSIYKKLDGEWKGVCNASTEE